MSYEKIARLVRALSKKTADGKIEWKSTVDDGVFQVSFPNYSVQVSTRPTRDERAEGQDVVVSIRNEEGELIEQVADIDFDNTNLPGAFRTMTNLYNSARRQALGVEKALDELLGEIGEEDGGKVEDFDDDIPF